MALTAGLNSGAAMELITLSSITVAQTHTRIAMDISRYNAMIIIVEFTTVTDAPDSWSLYVRSVNPTTGAVEAGANDWLERFETPAVPSAGKKFYYWNNKAAGGADANINSPMMPMFFLTQELVVGASADIDVTMAIHRARSSS